MYRPLKPYNDLPRLPIPFDFENRIITKQLIQSVDALSSLNASIKLTPNPNVLLNNLSIAEARDSSQIENIVTTNDHLYKAISLKKKLSQETKEVLNYRDALWKGIESLKKRPLSTNSFVEIVNLINENTSGIRKTPGTTLKNQKKEVIYTPPEGEDVIRDLLKNLEDFIHCDTDGLHPLIKMGILHYQYESIHPFYDGNGRSGRILNILYLLEKKVIDHPSLYLSRYLLKNRDRYYKGLQGVRDHHHWNDWILLMLKAVEETARYNFQQVSQINRMMDDTKILIQQVLKKNIDTDRFTNILYTQPYSRPSHFLKGDIKNIRTVNSYLNKLHQIGLLKKENTVFGSIYLNQSLSHILEQTPFHPNLLNLLNQYECQYALTINEELKKKASHEYKNQ
ncbi:MAG: Fic family protein [Flavobacteriaceae bacterium]|nr:Fic family protein [Flavobacteriaceae bacterium]